MRHRPTQEVLPNAMTAVDGIDCGDDFGHGNTRVVKILAKCLAEPEWASEAEWAFDRAAE